jgi:iron complex outermembrane receptor protein
VPAFGKRLRGSIQALPIGAVALLFAAPAEAQRTDDNAVEDADDAFGKSIGGEQIGIYSPDNVRNFSPIAAGNVRIEGLYFDQQAHPTDRAIEARTVHVGISAQGYPFPAPTGIADYDLRKPGKDAVLSAAFNIGPYGGTNTEFDGELPILGEKLGITAGIGIHRAVFDHGGTQSTESYGLTLRYQPAPNISIQPFYGRIEAGDEERPSFILPNGAFLPPRIERPKFYGQEWADFDATLQVIGTVAKARLGGFDLGLGLFRSQLDVDNNFNDLLRETDPDGHVGDRLIIAERDNEFGSTSGELTVARSLTDGPRRHTVRLSARGRRLERTYGGSSLVSLGESRVGIEDFRPEPVFSFGAKTNDEVRQQTLGLGYQLLWRDLGELSLGVQKTRYRKSVVTPTEALPETRDNPFLWSATGAVYVSDKFAVYGGYTRGLEESDVAPANAINRNEAPPAIRTRQQEIGVRYAIAPRLSLIVGLFDIEKPYFNLDSQDRFRELGTLTNRGVEVSLAGQITRRLTVVAGSTWIDQSVSGELVDSGVVGKRPLGAFKLRNLANLNWQLPWHEKLTLTARFESTSARNANKANTFEIPARWVAGLGARYRTTVGNVPVLVRANVDNIFDRYGWNVTGSGFFTPNGPRRYYLTVAADF